MGESLGDCLGMSVNREGSSWLRLTISIDSAFPDARAGASGPEELDGQRRHETTDPGMRERGELRDAGVADRAVDLHAALTGEREFPWNASRIGSEMSAATASRARTSSTVSS